MSLQNSYHIMRHGESEANLAGIIVSSPERGVPSFGLTSNGRIVARDSLSRYGFTYPVTRIISSDFRRALETARIAAEVLGTGEPEINFLLRERFFGDLEGKDDSGYERIWKGDRLNPDNSLHGVESPRQVALRAITLFEKLEEQHTGEGILLVSHGDTLQIMQTVLAGQSPCLHREIPHLHPAEIRPVEVKKSFIEIKETV